MNEQNFKNNDWKHFNPLQEADIRTLYISEIWLEAMLSKIDINLEFERTKTQPRQDFIRKTEFVRSKIIEKQELVKLRLNDLHTSNKTFIY